MRVEGLGFRVQGLGLGNAHVDLGRGVFVGFTEAEDRIRSHQGGDEVRHVGVSVLWLHSAFRTLGIKRQP